MNVILCGMMGCGKSTVAGVLSKKYGMQLVDTDAIIVSRYGEIDKIFKLHGEERFRDIEEQVVKEVALSAENSVVSLGGGCVLRAVNVTRLKACGKIIYLRTKEETLIKRLKGDTTRPLLAGDIEERVKVILSSRARIYEGVADLIIDTDGLTPEEIAIKIKERAV